MRFGWDELFGEVYPVTQADTLGWLVKKVHDNGVVETRSDRGHLAVEVDASDADAAHALFMEVPSYKEHHE